MTNNSVTDFSILSNACDDLKREALKIRDLWYDFNEIHQCPTRNIKHSLIKIDYLLRDLEEHLAVVLKK